jgi:hypothetical protein
MQDPTAVTHSLTVKQELTIATSAIDLLPTHTHSYLPLAGGTMTGSIVSQTIRPTTTNTYNLGSSDYIWKKVYATTFSGSLVSKDIRSLTGVTSDFADKTLTPFFSNVTMPTTNWWSGFTSKGWTSDYNSWQLVGYSAQGDASALDLYWRNGVNNVWNTWKKILDTSREINNYRNEFFEKNYPEHSKNAQREDELMDLKINAKEKAKAQICVKYGDLSDMFIAAGVGDLCGMGHSGNYWTLRHIGNECFAEITSAKATNPASLELMKQYIPKSLEIYDEIMDQIKNKKNMYNKA